MTLFKHVCVLSRFSHVQLLVTPWTVACQAPLSRGFSRQEHWRGLPCPPPWESSWPRDQTLLCLLHHRQILYHWATWEAHTLFKYYPIIVLQFVGHVLGSFMVWLMMTSSKRASATHYVSQVCFSQSPVPMAGHCWRVPPQETLKHSKAGLAQPLWGFWVLVRTRFCLSPPSISGGYGVWF